MKFKNRRKNLHCLFKWEQIFKKKLNVMTYDWVVG